MHPLFHEIFQRARYLSKELNYVLKEHELFSSQWSVLYCIYEKKQMTLTEIWTYLSVEAPTMTRTVHRLVELGWLAIVPAKDRREKVVTLTEKAIERLPAIEASILAFEQQFLEQLTEDEAQQLSTLLRKLQKKG